MNMNVDNLKNAFNKFLEMHTEYKNIDSSTSDIMKEAIKEALAHRLEYSVEMFWKTLKRYLKEYELVEDVDSPKGVIIKAGDLGLLDKYKWIDYLLKRKSTSHDYDEKKLEELLTVVDNFATDGAKLLKLLETKINEEQ